LALWPRARERLQPKDVFLNMACDVLPRVKKEFANMRIDRCLPALLRWIPVVRLSFAALILLALAAPARVRTVYVRADAALNGGDGTRARPFRRITDALRQVEMLQRENRDRRDLRRDDERHDGAREHFIAASRCAVPARPVF
jgi:hypothetical protein